MPWFLGGKGLQCRGHVEGRACCTKWGAPTHWTARQPTKHVGPLSLKKRAHKHTTASSTNKAAGRLTGFSQASSLRFLVSQLLLIGGLVAAISCFAAAATRHLSDERGG